MEVFISIQKPKSPLGVELEFFQMIFKLIDSDRH